MKTRNIFLLALTAILGVSCHSWDEPSLEAGQDSYGNQYIQETNVVTIDALKTQYKSVINDNGLQQITKPTQIKVIVTGNDEGSNLYKQLYVSDGTGSLYMSIDKSGIFSEAAVGQCMLIELEGLYIGAYGKQPEIGTFYHNDSKNMDQVGRMSRYTWQDHFKLIPPVEGLSAKPEEIRSMSALDMEKDCGKLITLVGVKMKGADGKITFAPSDGSAQLVGGCVNRDIDGMSNVVVRTSTYAKYAAMIMPTEAIDITGIAARYNNTWQIMPRTQDDIQKSTHEPIAPPEPKGTGTASDPYNVAGVLAYVESLGADKESPNDVYFSGVITSVTEEFTTQYGNGTFVVSDDENAINSFTFYRGLYVGNKKYTASDTQVKKGDKVVICGKVINFKGTTPETSQNKAYIVSLNSEGGQGGGGDVQTVSIADFNAAAESTDTWYQITGTIKNLKDGDQYGNFDIEDATGSVYVYGLLAEKGGEKKKFQELVAAKGIANGKKITIIGNRSSYNGKIQVANAYFVKIEDGEGGGGTSSGDVQTVTVAQFNAAAESTNVWYQLTGTVKNLKDGDQYGNFDLEDETGSVYVYGLLAEKGGEKKKFQELVAAKGIANGKKITIIGNRGSYQDKIEVTNAYFVSIE
jgi:acylphosphatase